jgi:coproporphyrinogen III oxidase
MFRQRLFACWLLWHSVSSLTPQTSPFSNPSKLDAADGVQKTINTETTITVFHDFCQSLQTKQRAIIQELERVDGSGETFTNDTWGCFADEHGESSSNTSRSGGITRVMQGGDVIEKGACSFTLLQQGVLTSERAQAIRSRRQQQQQQGAMNIQAGDTYSAAALSIVLHSKSPLVPTFRSDVRIFNVETTNNKGLGMAWFGGGADLTPYFLFEEDITNFHQMYRNVCNQYQQLATPGISYQAMKEACDHYFYLPARCEHRGTGGIFFDDLQATPYSKQFVEAVADAWLPSWLPIVQKRRNVSYSDKMRQWQLLRRGRYLEFNLLYDRGVKFGLASANPRVEGIMVSAPPLIAFEYNHVIEEGSEEAKLMEVLKTPRDWVD